MEWFFEFPFKISIDRAAFDEAFMSFAIRHDSFFGGIKKFLLFLVSNIEKFLNMLPWWLLIALVIFLGWRSNGKLKVGLGYGLLLFAVGLIGYWEMMNITLAIVIASVFISLLFGLPLGVLVSSSDRADRIMRPILDTMQTMPVFVYLIPAVIFFSIGRAPSVVATTIYAIVPVIRLTSHGIRQVDAEVVEAALAFGSTKGQALWKVQIPQALPTIMAGVNQTLMMAMSMVVTCSMIGAAGLGNEVLIAVNRQEIARGLLSGSSVVIIAILLDRLTQGWFKKNEVKES